MKFLKQVLNCGRNADSYLEGTHDKQETDLTVPLSFLLASSAQSPAAEEVWCHSTDSDGAGRPSGPARTDCAACGASSWLCHSAPWPFLSPSLGKTLKTAKR